MSRLDQLISQYCPSGVPMVRLGEVCRTVAPPRKLQTSEYQETGEFPVIDQGQDYITAYTSDTDCLLPDGEYLLYGDHTCIVKYFCGQFAQGADGLKILQPKDGLCKYVYYAVCAHNITSNEYKRHWTQAKEISIPLPPLPVQEEIVRILDAMSDLVTNLDAEISARQKQYEHAREKLLTFGEEVERKTLGEVGEMIKGCGIMKSDFVDEGKPCIHYGQIHTYYKTSASEAKSHISEALYAKSKYALYGDLVIATTSEDVEACCKACAWLGEEPVAVSGDAHIFHHTQNAKYMSYLFQTEQFAAQKRLVATGAKVVRVAGNSILKFEFPLPSLSVQQSIVERLDKMESLIQNLQAERDLRQKQYEYYREKLLTF